VYDQLKTYSTYTDTKVFCKIEVKLTAQWKSWNSNKFAPPQIINEKMADLVHVHSKSNTRNEMI